MGRICVDLSSELEKRLRISTIERFGGKKGRPSEICRRSRKDMGCQIGIGTRQEIHNGFNRIEELSNGLVLHSM